MTTEQTQTAEEEEYGIWFKAPEQLLNGPDGETVVTVKLKVLVKLLR